MTPTQQVGMMSFGAGAAAGALALLLVGGPTDRRTVRLFGSGRTLSAPALAVLAVGVVLLTIAALLPTSRAGPSAAAGVAGADALRLGTLTIRLVSVERSPGGDGTVRIRVAFQVRTSPASAEAFDSAGIALLAAGVPRAPVSPWSGYVARDSAAVFEAAFDVPDAAASDVAARFTRLGQSAVLRLPSPCCTTP